MGRGLVCW